MRLRQLFKHASATAAYKTDDNASGEYGGRAQDCRKNNFGHHTRYYVGPLLGHCSLVRELEIATSEISANRLQGHVQVDD